MTMPKFHIIMIIRIFGTASISLLGFAHIRPFQDGGQKHGKTKSNQLSSLQNQGIFTVDLTDLKHLPIHIPVKNLHNSKWKRQKIVSTPSKAL